MGLCWQLAAVLHPALNTSGQRGLCHLHLGAELCITDHNSCSFRRLYNPCSCPKKGSTFQESCLTDVSNLFIKCFSDREANISLDNPFQYFSVLPTAKYLGFSPLKFMTAIQLSVTRGKKTVSLQSLLIVRIQDTFKLFFLGQNTSHSSSNETFFSMTSRYNSCDTFVWRKL